MQEPIFSELEPVDPRKYWVNEAADFSPWLSQPENLKRLGDAIGLDLELEAVEKNVGPYRADIVCRDTVTNDVVLIENQLAKTDHSHLGQLLTYTAALDALTIVWIAASFTDEHRAALDWLNEATGEEINFFGLEIEVWKIGNSQPAFKFNMVSQPNEWTKQIRSSQVSGNLTPTQEIQLRYWQAFREHLKNNSKLLRPTKAYPTNLYGLSIGRSDVSFEAYANSIEKHIGVLIGFWRKHARAYFHLLHEQREVIEQELGLPLEWNEKPGKKSCSIAYRIQNIDPLDESHWPTQHYWLVNSLEKIHKVFSPRIKALDPEDYYRELDEDLP